MIYLDNASTTRVLPEIAHTACEIMTQGFFNPDSGYSGGLDASHTLDHAREEFAKCVSCDASRVFFTSGGTDGNNIALLGAATKARRGHIITTEIEHSSVLAPAKRLMSLGFDVTFLPPPITPEAVKNALRENTVLVSVMSVNNETGAILPIAEISRAVRASSSSALIHTDAVAAFMKIPIQASAVDILTVSGHKIHAPKGVGAIYVRKGVRLTPLTFGARQDDLKPGTPAVSSIAAFAHACRIARENFDRNTEHMRGLLSTLRSALDGVDILSNDEAPNIMSIAIPKYPSEVLLRMFEERGVLVSSGSACSRGKKSHVLKAFGISPRLIGSAIRVSVCEENTREEILSFAEIVNRI